MEQGQRDDELQHLGGQNCTFIFIRVIMIVPGIITRASQSPVSTKYMKQTTLCLIYLLHGTAIVVVPTCTYRTRSVGTVHGGTSILRSCV